MPYFCYLLPVLHTTQQYHHLLSDPTFNEIERHAVAIGPSLQNPKFDTSTTAIDPKDMAYGTCVDVTIELNEKRYYIPAIITDVKGDTELFITIL